MNYLIFFTTTFQFLFSLWILIQYRPIIYLIYITDCSNITYITSTAQHSHSYQR